MQTVAGLSQHIACSCLDYENCTMLNFVVSFSSSPGVSCGFKGHAPVHAAGHAAVGIGQARPETPTRRRLPASTGAVRYPPINAAREDEGRALRHERQRSRRSHRWDLGQHNLTSHRHHQGHNSGGTQREAANRQSHRADAVKAGCSWALFGSNHEFGVIRSHFGDLHRLIRGRQGKAFANVSRGAQAFS